MCAWHPSAVERYRLVLPSLLPELLARDLREGALTENDLEEVVRGLGLPEQTIARAKSSSGATDALEPRPAIILSEAVGAHAYGASRSRVAARRDPNRSDASALQTLVPSLLQRATFAPKTVLAVEDLGVLSAGTRWKPRRMSCVERVGAPPVEHVVKLGRDPASAAALISEWVSGQLLNAGRVAVLDGRLVVIGPNAGAKHLCPPPPPGLALQGAPHADVPRGIHFGTLFRSDVEPIREELSVESLADPQQLVDVWVFDTWLCNIDRAVSGNLLAARGDDNKLHLIAADQSDCLGGNTALLSGAWRKIMRDRGAAESHACLGASIASSGGASAIERSLAKVDAALVELDAILASAPEVWWRMSGLRRDEVRTSLRDRRLHLERILDLSTWRHLAPATRGGIIL